MLFHTQLVLDMSNPLFRTILGIAFGSTVGAATAAVIDDTETDTRGGDIGSVAREIRPIFRIITGGAIGGVIGGSFGFFM